MKQVFNDRAVLITGAAGGLGSALAFALARLGARQLLVDKDSRGLDLIHDRICESGYEAPGLCPLDLSDAGPAAFEQLTGILESEFQGLDHLVHCAAEFHGLSPLDQTRPADWMSCIQVNLNAAWLLTVQCLPLLRKGANSSITFILDEQAKSRSAFWGAYGISKSALRDVSIMLGEELEGSGIRILGIDPGPMQTQLRATAYLAEDPSDLADPGNAAQEIIRRISQV